MIKSIAILVLAFLFVVGLPYAESQNKDPFESLLPQVVEEEEGVTEEIIEEIEELFPDMVIQGILWGGDLGQAIIDGEVYRVGDKLKDIDAQIFKIEKNAVFIFYGKKVYRMRTEKKRGNKIKTKIKKKEEDKMKTEKKGGT